MWEDMGMSKGYAAKELTKLRGYKLLKKDEALDAMFDSMTQAYSSIIIGIDGRNLNMQAYLNAPIKNQKQIKVEYQLADPSSPVELPPVNLDRRDSFGNELSFDFEEIEIADKYRSNSSEKDFVSTLTSIWETVLEIEGIAQNDNFFDLGGHSLLMIKVREKIKEELAIDIEMVDLFKFPTIKSLSKYLADCERSEVNTDGVLKSIWADILDLEDFSREDNFFDLGGHSLLMIKVKERINHDLNLTVEMIDLFKYPTLNDLSRFLKRQQDETLLPENSANTISLKRGHRRYRRQ
jgi:acyl carrier protein